MSETFLIEVGDEPAGLVFRDGQQFRFYAATQSFFALDGRSFPSPAHAERAATLLVSPRQPGDKAHLMKRPARAIRAKAPAATGRAPSHPALPRRKRAGISLWQTTSHRWLSSPLALQPLPHAQAKETDR